MYLMLLVAISFPFLDSEFTLKNVVSIDKLESGTDAERIDELESALRSIDNYRFTATPTEFRLVAEGLRHENEVIRAESARLLEILASKASENTVGSLIANREGNKTSDEDWMKIAYYLGRHSAIPSCDVYRGFQKHFPGRRCIDPCRFFGRFDFDSLIKTKDLEILEYALNRQLYDLAHPPEPPKFKMSNFATHHLKGLIKVHPDSNAADLAKRLFEQVGLIEPENAR